PFRDIRFLSVNGLFGPFRSVLGSPLAALVDADRIKGSANDMVTHARQVFDAAAADQNNGVFLQIVAFAGYIGGYLDAVGQPNTGHLSQGRVRLLRGGRVDADADAAALRTALQSRRRSLVARLFASDTD